jgi:hypothetical protein
MQTGKEKALKGFNKGRPGSDQIFRVRVREGFHPHGHQDLSLVVFKRPSKLMRNGWK